MTDPQEPDGRQIIQWGRVNTSRMKEQSHKAWALNEGLTFSHHKRMLWYITERRGLWRIIWKDVTNGKWKWLSELQISEAFVGQEYWNFGGNTVHEMAKVMHISSRRFCVIWNINYQLDLFMIGENDKTHFGRVLKCGILKERILILILLVGCRTRNRRRTCYSIR